MAGYTPQLGRQFAIQVAKKNNLDPNLFTAILQQESGFRADTVSPVGARGPGQFLPATWSDPGFGLSFEGDINDPYANIEASAKYFGAMQNRYNGDTRKALAAYNWGAGNADDWSGDPRALPEETRNYIAAITSNAGAGGEADIASMAMRNGPVTLADEARQPANSMFAPSIMEEREQKPQFHAGNALQSLGAAISATALGEGAAPQLGAIRDQYFAEQEAEYQKQMEQQQRLAMIDMVGADSAYGQALANGANPQAVLQAYMQERGFGHESGLQDQRLAHDWASQSRQFDFDIIRQEDAQMHDFTTIGVQDYYQTQRDENNHQNELDRLGAGSRLRREELGYADTLEQGKEQRGQSVTQSAAEQAQEAIALSLEAAGNKTAADAIRNMPVTPFGDNATIETLLETLAGPQVDADSATSAVKNWLFYQQLPEDQRGGFKEFMDAGGTNITVGGETIPGLGKLDTDYAYIPDPNHPTGIKHDENGVPVATVVPGSKTYTEQQAEKAAADKANATAAENNIIRGSHVTRALKTAQDDANSLTAGFGGAVLNMLPGSPARNLRATLDTIDSNIAFDRLSQMRAESPTGGALGSITEGELRLLKSTIASTDPTQGPEQLKANLAYIEQTYNSMIERVQNSGAAPAEKAEALRLLGVEMGKPEDIGSDDDIDSIIDMYAD